jgi:GNAT superfamily N-acetyltransferase
VRIGVIPYFKILNLKRPNMTEQNTKKEIVIELATLADAPVILEIQKVAYREEAEIYGDYSISQLHQKLASMEEDFAKHTVLKAVMPDIETEQPLIVGSVRAYQQDQTCFISRLMVRSGFANQGIGSRLMQAIEATFSQASRHELYTGYKSTRNLYLYQKLGYHVYMHEQVNELVTLARLEKPAKSQSESNAIF